MAIVPYAGTDTRGLVGMHADAQEWNARTLLADNVAAAPIGPGQPVARFAGNDKVGRAWATGAAVGVARWTVSVDTTTGFKEGDPIAVQDQGTMWVAAGAACTAGGAAYYNPTTDRWGNTGAAFVAVPGVMFDTNATAGRLVRLRIAIPATAAV